MLTTVYIEEDIYLSYSNRSGDGTPVTNYQWNVDPVEPQPFPMAYNMTAVGRGLELYTAFTWTYERLAFFTGDMVQTTKHPWANFTVEFSFAAAAPPGSKYIFEWYPIARGWFAPYNFSGQYDPSDGPSEAPQLVLNPQDPQTT